MGLGSKWKRIRYILAVITLFELSFFGMFYARKQHITIDQLVEVIKGLPQAEVAQNKLGTKKNEIDDVPYLLFKEGQFFQGFKSLPEAIHFAKSLPFSVTIRTKNQVTVWGKRPGDIYKDHVDAPFVSQHPELPRGCEVTALAMLLQYYGFQVNKMELAAEITKDRTSLTYDQSGQMFWGNPYKGFVGDMYDRSKPGFGVFHTPIEKLAQKYAGSRVVNYSGLSFDDILHVVKNGKPIWVIVNTKYKKVDTRLVQWMTKDGPISTTWHQHSVLLTGVDQEYVYFNDPSLTSGKNIKKRRDAFEQAWIQMGKQAIGIGDLVTRGDRH
ncbi:C39 family peptidase [Paenibacillus barengoltzii]|uniref:C39 family peptidase n=1 Tax=Paenibacillus barengoltzii TaxID=343517 RepID=UPI003F89A8EC